MLKERRQVLEAAKGHFEEGAPMWTTVDANMQQKLQPENAYMRCMKQMRIEKEQRDQEQKEVERLEKSWRPGSSDWNSRKLW